MASYGISQTDSRQETLRTLPIGPGVQLRQVTTRTIDISWTAMDRDEVLDYSVELRRCEEENFSIKKTKNFEFVFPYLHPNTDYRVLESFTESLKKVGEENQTPTVIFEQSLTITLYCIRVWGNMKSGYETEAGKVQVRTAGNF